MLLLRAKRKRQRHWIFDQLLLTQVYRVPPVPVVLENRLPLAQEPEIKALVDPVSQAGKRGLVVKRV